MGKFSGILLCSDLDDTLLTTDKQVSAENRAAIEYFKQEGGIFTFATGRAVPGLRLPLSKITPNGPVICLNGSGIYDTESQQMLWETFLDERAVEVVDFVERTYPFVGTEVCTRDTIYFGRRNSVAIAHKVNEKLPDNDRDYHDIKEPWKKILFMQNPEEVPVLKSGLQASQYARYFDFMQSDPCYYEVLPKGASKGAALAILAEILGIDPKNTIGVGDNENDLTLVKKAGVGVAVANAIGPVLAVADWISTDHNNHALAAVIRALEDGVLGIGGAE